MRVAGLEPARPEGNGFTIRDAANYVLHSRFNDQIFKYLNTKEGSCTPNCSFGESRVPDYTTQSMFSSCLTLSFYHAFTICQVAKAMKNDISIYT